MLSLPRNRFTLSSYFPYPKFQKKFLFVTLSVSLITLTIVAFILYHFLSQNYEIFSLLADTDPELGMVFRSEFNWLIGAIISTFFLYFTLMIFINLMISHSVAGVLYAFRRTIRELKAGKEVRLKLREKDEFQELADEFNELIDSHLQSKTSKSA